MANDEIKDEEQVDIQKKYLMAKINELIDGVGSDYGGTLMEELISRMERTVGHFHDEVTELLETLKSRAQERNDRLKSMISEQEIVTDIKEAPISSAEQEMSDWEMRLEAKETEKKKSDKIETAKPSKEEEKPKKKGLFKRK